MGHIQGGVLGLQPGGTAQGLLPTATTLQLQSAAHQHQLEAPVVPGMNLKGARHRDSPAAGLESLRQIIAKTTKDYSGFEINSDNVIVSNGGKQSILTAFLSILDPGDEVIIPAPYWTTYPEAVKIAGGTPVFIETEKSNNFKVTVEQLEKSKSKNTKMLVWCSPSNPTGVVYTKEEAEEIYEWIFKNDLWILSD